MPLRDLIERVCRTVSLHLLTLKQDALSACLPSRVDALLDGGFRQGQLTELAGETAAGKTQVSFTRP
jgi:hypothetical protein